MNNIDPNTGEVIPRGNSPRFQLWLAFFAFATIVMGSAVEVKNKEEETSSNSRWAVFCSSFSFATTGVVTAMHLSSKFSHYVVGTKIEGVLTLVLAAFWSATVSVVANASNGLAIDPTSKENTIVNGNLYYFSWAGFVTSILLLVSYLRSVFGVDVYGEVKNRANRLMLWAGFLACQMVVMGASANAQNAECTAFDDDTAYYDSRAFCGRTKFGIIVGAIGTVIALCVVAMKMLTQISPLVIEGVLSLVLCVMNGFGVAYLTSPQGPGSAIGNLYYFTWLSWLCSFMLIASVYEDYQDAGNTNSEEGENKVDGDIPVETIGSVEDV